MGAEASQRCQGDKSGGGAIFFMDSLPLRLVGSGFMVIQLDNLRNIDTPWQILCYIGNTPAQHEWRNQRFETCGTVNVI